MPTWSLDEKEKARKIQKLQNKIKKEYIYNMNRRVGAMYKFGKPTIYCIEINVIYMKIDR